MSDSVYIDKRLAKVWTGCSNRYRTVHVAHDDIQFPTFLGTAKCLRCSVDGLINMVTASR